MTWLDDSLEHIKVAWEAAKQDAEPRHQKEINNRNHINSVVNMLKQNASDAKLKAMKELLPIAKKEMYNKTLIARADGIYLLCEIFKDLRQTPNMQELACELLICMVDGHEGNKTAVLRVDIDMDGAGMLVHMLNNGNPRQQTLACNLAAHVAYGAKLNQLKLTRRDALTPIIRLCKSGKEEQKRAACHALANLIQAENANRVEIAIHGGYDFMHALAKDKDEELAARAVAAIETLDCFKDLIAKARREREVAMPTIKLLEKAMERKNYEELCRVIDEAEANGVPVPTNEFMNPAKNLATALKRAQEAKSAAGQQKKKDKKKKQGKEGGLEGAGGSSDVVYLGPHGIENTPQVSHPGLRFTYPVGFDPFDLLKPMKRQLNNEGCRFLVGCHLEIYWGPIGGPIGEDEWFDCVVINFDEKSGLHTVRYKADQYECDENLGMGEYATPFRDGSPQGKEERARLEKMDIERQAKKAEEEAAKAKLLAGTGNAVELESPAAVSEDEEDGFEDEEEEDGFDSEEDDKAPLPPLPSSGPAGSGAKKVLSLAQAGKNFSTGRVAESTIGGETTCIVCFERPKSHLAAPCGHQCACGPCAEEMTTCPVCRSAVASWIHVRVA